MDQEHLIHGAMWPLPGGNGSGLVTSRPHEYGWPDPATAKLSEIPQSFVDPLGEPGTLGDCAARTPFPPWWSRPTGIRWEWLPAVLGFGSGMIRWRPLRDWNTPA
jgi:hypothetical protein